MAKNFLTYIICLLLSVLTIITHAHAHTKPAEKIITLQSGDIIYIGLLDEQGFNQKFTIDKNGEVMLPEVGRVALSGMSIKDANSHLQQKLSSHFLDYEQAYIILKERRLAITVLGYVLAPQTINISEDDNIQIAIEKAGGFKEGAQLDDIQIKRGDETYRIDYRQYVNSGDISIFPKLETNDIIFVPASGLTSNVYTAFSPEFNSDKGDSADKDESVQIFGEVHSPGTYKYIKGASAMDMIIRAGGMTRYAGVEQIRIIHNNQPIPFNMKLYLDTVNPSYMPPISGGDVIFVPQKVQGVDSGAKTVYVIGEVHKPGSFEIQKSISFLEMLSNSGGPTRYADPRHIKIIKRDKIIPFDMIRYVNNKNLQVPMVEAGDAIFVPYKHNMIEGAWLNIPSDKAVEIIGLVNKPGRYEWASDMNFFDYLGHAGGATRRGNTSMVEILIPQDDGTRKGFLFDMERFLRQGGNESQLPQIKGGTVINIPALPDDPSDNKSQWIKQSSDSSIYVFGEVGSPGRYAFNSSLNLLDIITAADSTTKEADLRNITITHRHDEKSKVSHVNLSRYFQTGDESLLPKILPEDVIYVPEKSEFANWLDIDKEFTIRVLGEVKKPGRYRFEESMTILDLLAAAEGFTADAMEERIVVVNSTYHHGNNSRLFNMVEFAKTGDFDMLPLVKVGDTVYVPHDNQSHWERVAGTMRDLASVVLAPLLLLTGIK